jgi:hypothetical protein
MNDKTLVADIEGFLNSSWNGDVGAYIDVQENFLQRCIAELKRREWQSIENAPKDGTDVDLWGWIPYDMTEIRLVDCEFKQGEWLYYVCGTWKPITNIDFTPTHFKLPTPPEGN